MSRYVPHVCRALAVACIVAAGLPSAACGGASTDAAPPAGGMPPAAVAAVTLAEKPVADASEFVATIQSLRSTTIQPQVEGLVTRVFVASGDRVRAGQPLAQIDPDRMRAAVSSLEATRAAREADVAFATQQRERARTLFEGGAMSRQDLDQAETAFKTATAQLEAATAQIRESRVQLGYYRVTAPTAGTIGDIPVRVGDRVTPSTVITTIDDHRGLEAYIPVPLEQAHRLAPKLPVELIDAGGTVFATSAITFIASRADEATQSVLVKGQLPAGTPVRVLQYVRARIVWNTEPALTVPIIAVTRVSGGYFCFVAEAAEGGFVARQRPIQVGAVVGDEYVVRSGLRAGERVIVSGIQKLGDGAPVAPTPESGASS